MTTLLCLVTLAHCYTSTPDMRQDGVGRSFLDMRDFGNYNRYSRDNFKIYHHPKVSEVDDENLGAEVGTHGGKIKQNFGRTGILRSRSRT